MDPKALPKCMIVTNLAQEFASEIARLSDLPIPVKACNTTEQARAGYAGEPILFGNPAMIAPLLDAMPKVQWIQSSWAGVTPLIDAPRRDYLLTGVKDVFGPQMSEYVIGYLLAHELKVLERKAQQRKRTWYREHSGTLGGKRLGIMGTGSIGRHIALTAKQFDMQVCGLNRTGNPAAGFDEVMGVDRLHEFLAGTDYLVATLPQTPQTRHLLDAAALAALPEHAYFINVGRSNVVDDAALVQALERGSLAGAALDVFDEEPVPADSPLWEVPGLSITAHVAAISHPLLIVPIFVENYRRFLNDEPLQYVVDFDTGY